MIIDNSKFDLSLRDTSNLRKLIIENPDLPLLIFCGEESWLGDWAYNSAPYASKGSIQTLTLYKDCYVGEDDYRDRLIDDLCDEEEYKDLSDEDYYKMIDQKVAETEFCKAIVIYVG
jgi:hypothetical protein